MRHDIIDTLKCFVGKEKKESPSASYFYSFQAPPNRSQIKKTRFQDINEFDGLD